MARRGSLLAVVAATLLLSVQPGSAGPGPVRYVAGGTVVVKDAGDPVADEGVLVCAEGASSGIGGACLPFGPGTHVTAFDAVFGPEVAFQVCIDNNGDRRCEPPPPGPEPCPDQLFFSHDDAGVFHNPLGPLPAGFLSGCGAGAFPGYLVFLCEAVHMVGPEGPHPHPATHGTVFRTFGPPSGMGTFCLGSPVVKNYILV